MTFASEEVRMAFHQLPTQTQVEYTEMENRFADRGSGLHIEAVNHHADCLEVVVRVSHQFKPASRRISNSPFVD